MHTHIRTQGSVLQERRRPCAKLSTATQANDDDFCRSSDRHTKDSEPLKAATSTQFPWPPPTIKCAAAANSAPARLFCPAIWSLAFRILWPTFHAEYGKERIIVSAGVRYTMGKRNRASQHASFSLYIISRNRFFL